MFMNFNGVFNSTTERKEDKYVISGAYLTNM